MRLVKFNKKLIFSALMTVACASVLVLGLRGNLGNPQAEDLLLPQWREDGPFELSPERGRFALLYSFIENQSLKFSIPLARFSTPDIAISPDGEYVSLFMPGVSFLVIPGYHLGKYFGAAQIGTFAMISVFAFLNLFLIRGIIIRLGGDKIAATLAGFTFVFATPAFAYAVSLYQHHISTFIILASLYILLRWKNFWSLAAIWFLCALAVVVDNPNLFMMLPIGIYASGRILILKKEAGCWGFRAKPLLVLTFITMLLPVGFFLWFNQASYGSPFQLPGTLPAVEAVDEKGMPSNPSAKELLEGSSIQESGKEKNALGFFKTRNLLNGFYIHFLSPDRGVLWFSPVILLGICGLIFLYRKNKGVVNLFVGIIGINTLLYSMWGDPWGGWAFGSRYLIPTYALLAVGLGLALGQKNKKIWLLAVFFCLFVYSAGVNTLGALTSNANPPKVQVLNLEKLSGMEQKYTFMRNWQFLQNGNSKSFVFRSWANKLFSAEQYYFIVYALVVVAGVVILIALVKPDKKLADK